MDLWFATQKPETHIAASYLGAGFSMLQVQIVRANRLLAGDFWPKRYQFRKKNETILSYEGYEG